MAPLFDKMGRPVEMLDIERYRGRARDRAHMTSKRRDELIEAVNKYGKDRPAQSKHKKAKRVGHRHWCPADHRLRTGRPPPQAPSQAWPDGGQRRDGVVDARRAEELLAYHRPRYPTVLVSHSVSAPPIQPRVLGASGRYTGTLGHTRDKPPRAGQTWQGAVDLSAIQSVSTCARLELCHNKQGMSRVCPSVPV